MTTDVLLADETTARRTVHEDKKVSQLLPNFFANWMGEGSKKWFNASVVPHLLFR